jgi:hypothetical protein
VGSCVGGNGALGSGAKSVIRTKQKIPNVTTIITGHGNIRSYLHTRRLKLMVSPECACNHEIQTADHLIVQCKRLRNEKAILKSSVLKVGKWPVSKSELIRSTIGI